MSWVIITVLLIVIIVPIFSVLPNARQRAQMKMRNAARGVGVMVELTTITDPNPKQDKYISHIGKRLEPNLKVAAYRVQRKRDRDWRQLPKVNWCLKKSLDGVWQWDEPINEHLSVKLRDWLVNAVEELPDDVEQVEEIGYNITIYWHERAPGDEQHVFEFLGHCTSLPLHEPVPDSD